MYLLSRGKRRMIWTFRIADALINTLQAICGCNNPSEELPTVLIRIIKHLISILEYFKTKKGYINLDIERWSQLDQKLSSLRMG